MNPKSESTGGRKTGVELVQPPGTRVGAASRHTECQEWHLPRSKRIRSMSAASRLVFHQACAQTLFRLLVCSGLAIHPKDIFLRRVNNLVCTALPGCLFSRMTGL